MTEKSHTLAMRERVSTLFREVHSHSVAHFRASSGLFAEGWERARKPATGWLCWQSAANDSPLVKFPDHRKLQAMSSILGQWRLSHPPKHNRLAAEFPDGQNRESSLKKQGASQLKWGIRI